jgi:hypothetical protein
MATKSKGKSGGSHTTTDHEEIRKWVEERGGKPVCVKGTKSKDDTCLLRIDFPGGAGDESFEDVSWDNFFKTFDENNLSFLYQEGESTFNKFVSGDSESGKSSGKSSGRGGGTKSAGSSHGRGAK